jgi:hypothetical protein
VSEPIIVHASHPKSGSTWITDILARLAGERFVEPLPALAHIAEPLRAGAVYPRVYHERSWVDGLEAEGEVRILFTTRDLRDTLVSAYWSLRESHVPIGEVPRYRENLLSRDIDSGLIWMFDEWLDSVVAIQRSWVGFEPTLRYEDLIADDVGLLVPALSGTLGLGTPEAVEEAVVALRFERTSGGRSRGVEDRSSHYRKGVAGDWRNHLSGPVKDAVKERYGEHLILTGYETSLDW